MRRCVSDGCAIAHYAKGLCSKHYYVDYNRSRRPARARHHGPSNHGVSLNEYAALYVFQGGRCAVCASPRPMAWRRGNLELDHDHETGEVRGLLCGDCNSSAGRVGDDADRLRRLADYLDSSRYGLFTKAALTAPDGA